MGDPGKKRKKYQVPSHPWQKERIDEENSLKKEYGTKNKEEIYRLDSLLRKFKAEAKRLVALKSEQAETEKKQLMEKLQGFNLVKAGADLADVLALSLRDLMERRIQTSLIRKGLARTPKQARQFITHRHVMVGGNPVTSPSKLLTLKQESTLEFIPSSPFANPTHPEREIKKEEKEAQPKKKKPKERKKGPKKKIEKKGKPKKAKKGESKE